MLLPHPVENTMAYFIFGFILDLGLNQKAAD